MLREIEDFYQPNDNEDWSFAAERAQASVLPSDRGFTLLFRSREYRFSRTIRLIRRMSLIGSGAGKNFSGTLLRFPAGITGIVCEFPNPDTSPDRGDYSIIERLYMLGDSSSGADLGPPDPCGAGGSHGIVMHAAAILRDVAIEQFGGDGIHICASHGFAPKSAANLWQIYNCRAVLCSRNGLYVHGADSNAGCAIALDCEDNSGWGILDESLLNNTYLACHVANGSATAGNRGYRAAGMIPPDQSSPKPVARGAGSLFVGCYLEGNMTSEIEAPNAVLGGILGNLGNQPPNTGMTLSHARGVAEFPNSLAAGNQKLSSSGRRVYGVLGSADVEDTALELWVDNFLQGDVYRFTYSTRGNPSTLGDPPGYFELKYNNITGSVLSFSTSEADLPPGSLWMPAGYYVGLPTARSERVQVLTGNAPPTSGTAQKGDRVLNSDPFPGDPVRGFAGWICVASGTPGAWKGYGLIES